MTEKPNLKPSQVANLDAIQSQLIRSLQTLYNRKKDFDTELIDNIKRVNGLNRVKLNEICNS